jgi:hypothetical protein
VAEAQLVVLWQSSQVLVLAMWVEDFPAAAFPSWQLKQEPVAAA